MTYIEVWKEVVGYEGLYQVSNQGRVKSLVGWNGRKYIQREKMMALSNTTTGYKKVDLVKDGIKKTYKVHRLVATAFIPNIETKPEVNHKDGNKINNRAENLEWCTKNENVQHSYDLGLKKNFRISKETLEQLYIADKYNMNEIAQIYGVTTQMIYTQMKKHGIKRRTSAEARNKSQIDLAVLLEEFKTGATNRDLACKYKCSPMLIATRKYQLRKKGELNG